MNANEKKRENRLRIVEDHIGRHLAESERTGELRTAKNFGKPQDLGDGYAETPEELRMGYKILKDAGVVPPEVELMRMIETLSREVANLPAGKERSAQAQRLSESRLQLAILLEQVRR